MFDERPTLADANAMGEGRFPGHVGLVFTHIAEGEVDAELVVRSHHLAPNGYLHAGVVVTLADTCCGYGVRTCPPDGATGFTTLELKSNFLGTATEGTVRCRARLTHGGRSTQVWDAEVERDDGRRIALFRATQMLLYRD